MKFFKLVPLCALVLSSTSFASSAVSDEYLCVLATPKSPVVQGDYLYQNINLVVDGLHVKVPSDDTGEVVQVFVQSQSTEYPDGHSEPLGVYFEAQIGTKDVSWVVSQGESPFISFGLVGETGKYSLSCAKKDPTAPAEILN